MQLADLPVSQANVAGFVRAVVWVALYGLGQALRLCLCGNALVRGCCRTAAVYAHHLTTSALLFVELEKSEAAPNAAVQLVQSVGKIDCHKTKMAEVWE